MGQQLRDAGGDRVGAVKKSIAQRSACQFDFLR
jgi:hypothetical protein